MSDCNHCGDHEGLSESVNKILGGIKVVGCGLVFFSGLISFIYINDRAHDKEKFDMVFTMLDSNAKQIQRNQLTYEDLFIFREQMKRELSSAVEMMRENVVSFELKHTEVN